MTRNCIRWFTAVVSAPRNPPTLPATLDSLARAGWTDAVVFCDWERRGAMWNWRKALESSVHLAAYRKDDWLLICEDDIEVTPGLRHSLWSPRSDNELLFGSVFSLYCPSYLERTNLNNRPSWQSIVGTNLHGSHGALAYAIAVSTAESMLNAIRSFGPRSCGFSGADHFVSWFCREFERPYFFPSPSFVRHTGTHSSLRRPVGDDRFRQCHSWVERIRDDGTFVVRVEGGNEADSANGPAAVEDARPPA